MSTSEDACTPKDDKAPLVEVAVAEIELDCADDSEWLTDDDEVRVTQELGNEFVRVLEAFQRSAPEQNKPWHCGNLALFVHPFVYGMLTSITQGIIYGTMQGVMALPAHSYATVRTTVFVPLCLKFCFGFLSDTFPVFGYRRKSYAFIGWILVTGVLVLLMLFYREPEPYYCFDGAVYDHSRVCNAAAHDSAGYLVGALTVLMLGLVIADSAAQGLTVEICHAVALADTEHPGNLQVTLMMLEALGSIVGCIGLAVFFNGPRHLGKFEEELELWRIFAMMASFSLFVAMSWICLAHSDCRQSSQTRCCSGDSPHTYVALAGSRCRNLFNLFTGPPFALFILYNLVTQTLVGMETPVEGMIWHYWVKVDNLEAQVAQLLTYLFYILALALAKSYLLNISWRWVVSMAVLGSLQINVAVCLLTAMNAVRNEYLFLGRNLLRSVPMAVNTVISRLACVPLSALGQEASLISLVSSVHAVADPLGRGLANPMYSAMPMMWSGSAADHGALSLPANYVDDKEWFRIQVALSYCVYFFIVSCSLGLLPWLPNNRQAALDIANIPLEKRSTSVAVSVLGLLLIALVTGVVMGVSAFLPGVSCMQAFGGPGC
jgi:hypothetical protein